MNGVHVWLQHAPNFLQASDLHSHVKPVAIVPDPEPEVATPAEEAPTDLLIDTSMVSVNHGLRSLLSVAMCLKVGALSQIFQYIQESMEALPQGIVWDHWSTII